MNRSNNLEIQWIFEVDEVDEDISTNLSILQELEIDIELIYQTIKWMLSYPWFWMFCNTSSTRSHPLISPTSQKEFWGPCFVVSFLFIYLFFKLS